LTWSTSPAKESQVVSAWSQLSLPAMVIGLVLAMLPVGLRLRPVTTHVHGHDHAGRGALAADRYAAAA
jgi:hypothetical protein